VNLTGVTRAGTAGDSITFRGITTAGVNIITSLTEGVDYTCAAAASDIECVCNLYDAIEAHGTLGPAINTVRTDGTCSDEKLFFGVEPGVLVSLDVNPSDDANTVTTRGDTGRVILGNFGTGSRGSRPARQRYPVISSSVPRATSASPAPLSSRPAALTGRSSFGTTRRPRACWLIR
jgi:hypothetical protein